MKHERRFLSFWWLQTTGWIAYCVAVVLAMLPYLRFRDELVYRGVFTSSCFLASFVVYAFCRALWRRRTPWPQAMPLAVDASCLLGFICAALATWTEQRFGYVPARTFYWSHALGGGVNGAFVLTVWSAFYFGIKHHLATETEHKRLLEMEALARDAVLRALRYQIHPHFLFNTLNSISTLVVEGNTQAATRMIARLADFLRATLESPEDGGHLVTLAQELRLTEQYLDIEKARLADRLTLVQRVSSGTLQALVPHLLLQPLVENAIRHGITPQLAGGAVTIEIHRVGERLHLSVSDNGAGMRTDPAPVAGIRSKIGLENITARLRQLYGEEQRLELHFPIDGGCIVQVELPFIIVEQQPEELARGTAGS